MTPGTGAGADAAPSAAQGVGQGTLLVVCGTVMLLAAAVCGPAVWRLARNAHEADAVVRASVPVPGTVINSRPVERNRTACHADAVVQTADRRVYAVRFHSPPNCERPVVGSPVLVHPEDPVPGRARPWTEIARVAARDRWISRWYLLPAGLVMAGVLVMGTGFWRLSRAAEK